MFSALSVSQSLRVIFDGPLRTRVDGHVLGHPPAVGPKPLGPVPEFARWGGAVRPMEVLHLLGEALTPALPRDAFEESRRAHPAAPT